MQYRNLNLDKLQAFAPNRKMIDKENIYNAFMGLGNVIEKGADAYTLNKIYQLSPDEQQRKMAEYRGYKGDFSGFDNIEQAKLRQAEMNALREQQAIDKENEEAIVQRDKSNSYDSLIREYDVLSNELLNNMKRYNSENMDSPYHDVNNKSIQFRFLQEQDTGLLQRFITNLTEKEKLGYESKDERAKAEDVFGLEKIDRTESKIESLDDTVESTINVDNNVFNRDSEMQKYFKDARYQSKRGLSNEQKATLKNYITRAYNLYNNKVIVDGFTDDEIKKIKDVGFDTTTQADAKATQSNINKTENKNKYYDTLSTRFVEQANLPKPMKNESNEDYVNRMIEKYKDNQIYMERINNLIEGMK